ncbi:hypothetical protein M405DRAFT_288040 [Rhizopogon salebrosus TDB-379]|nr:hypothetical protein M405DRAFT_288040 [Rhizopogon salebrosus TDB-379]
MLCSIESQSCTDVSVLIYTTLAGPKYELQALCQNIYDRLGCAYNAPNNAQKGVFEVCEGDDMSPVGVLRL